MPGNAGVATPAYVGRRQALPRRLARTEARSRLWYPVLKAGRRVLLFVSRVPRIGG